MRTRFAFRLPPLLVVLALLAPGAAEAHDFKKGSITVAKPWSRATVVKVGAAYMTLENSGREPDRLVNVASPMAERVEIHETKTEGGTAKMLPVSAVEVKPGGKIEFKPGGLHVMLMGLKEPLKEGGTLKLTLTFEKAGIIEVEAAIQKAGAMQGHTH